MAASAVLKDEQVDKIVAEYLRKRNLTETLKVLELEIKATGEGAEEASAQVWSESGLLEGVLLGTTASGNPAVYASEFNQFSSWADGSLEQYRAEYARLTYPVFVHTYLNLIRLRSTAEAHKLLAEHRQRFLPAGGLASKHRLDELHELQNITMPEHLATNRLAQAMRSERYPIRISSYAYDILVHYLQVSQLFLMLGIVNDHIAIELADLPQQAGTAEEEAALAAPDLADAAAVNQSAVTFQLLKGGIEQKHLEAMNQKAEDEAAAKADDENAKLTKKQRFALQKEAALAKTRRETVGDDRMVAQIPLPDIPEEKQTALLQEMSLREKSGAGGHPVSHSALPSAAFFTFVNTHHALNCVAYASDVQRLAGGYADSSLRVYNLSGSSPAIGSGPSTSQAGGSMSNPVYLCGHSGPVYATDFSPDDQLLLSTGADGTLRLWSMELNVALTSYRGHMLPVWDGCFAPHYGYYFASGGADRTARVWCTERTQPLRMFVGHQSDVDVVKWHPNCHYVASGSSDKTVRLWDVRTGGCVRILVGHRAGITSMSFSPDGTTLVSGDNDGTLISWDLGSARRLALQAHHKGPIWSLTHSQGEGSVVASGGADCTVRLWNGRSSGEQEVGTNQTMLQPLTVWRTKATPVCALAFSTRNLLLGAGSLTTTLPTN